MFAGQNFTTTSAHASETCRAVVLNLIAKYPSVKEKFDFILTLSPDVEYYINAHDNELQTSLLSLHLVLYTISCSLYDLMLSEKNTYAEYVTGYSLGIYSALYASGLITFEQGVDIIIMQNKYISELQLQKTGMIACFASNKDTHSQQSFQEFIEILQQVCYETNITFQYTYTCAISHYNSHSQIILSGHTMALEYASNILSNRDNIKTKTLYAEHAYHSSIIQSAAIAFEKYLVTYIFVEKKSAKIHSVKSSAVQHPVFIFNSDGQCLAISNNDTVIDVKLLSQLIASQLYKPIYWIQTLDTLIDADVTHFYELGAENALEELLLKHSKADTLEIFSISDI